MKQIKVEIPNEPYTVYVGDGILDQFADTLDRYKKYRQIVVISSKNIFDLYGEKLLSGFKEKLQVRVLLVPDGEKAKSLQQVEALYTSMLEKHIERGALIVALGGGVVGDIAGFVAATYLRGVDFVQVPTTLLAQVDSSIGGKTGVNHKLGKNLIGAFKQPLFVFVDTDVLQSLPDAEIRCGLGEAIKYGFILNHPLFDYLLGHIDKVQKKDPQALLHVVEQSIQEKAQVVAQDEKESGLRMILNFGHTFGHALEAELGYENLKHGEAVILGMQCALLYTKESGQMPVDDFETGMKLLKSVPVAVDKVKLSSDHLLEHMTRDKKVKDKNIRLVLTEQIGTYKMEEQADKDLIQKTWQNFIRGDF